MKAIIVYGPGDIRMVEVDKPKLRSRDALIKVAFCGICGTDLSIFNGELNQIWDGIEHYPVRIGHEWSGIVEEVGYEVKKIKPGDRVVSDSGCSCGECKYCLEGNYSQCRNGRSLGTIGNCWDGAFAEYMIMPEWHLYKLPDSIELDEAALIEPAVIALSGLKESNVSPGKNVLVIGTGAIGLTAVALAKHMGARVLLSGRKASKLEMGKRVGADVAINITIEDLFEVLKRETKGRGIDAIIETSGSVDALNQSALIIRSEGIISLIGFYLQELNHFRVNAIVLKRAQIKGITGGFNLPQEVIDMMTAGNISFKPLITHRFKFDEAIDAMKTADEKNETKIKMLVEF